MEPRRARGQRRQDRKRRHPTGCRIIDDLRIAHRSRDVAPASATGGCQPGEVKVSARSICRCGVRGFHSAAAAATARPGASAPARARRTPGTADHAFGTAPPTLAPLSQSRRRELLRPSRWCCAGHRWRCAGPPLRCAHTRSPELAVRVDGRRTPVRMLLPRIFAPLRRAASRSGHRRHRRTAERSCTAGRRATAGPRIVTAAEMARAPRRRGRYCQRCQPPHPSRCRGATHEAAAATSRLHTSHRNRSSSGGHQRHRGRSCRPGPVRIRRRPSAAPVFGIAPAGPVYTSPETVATAASTRTRPHFQRGSADVPRRPDQSSVMAVGSARGIRRMQRAGMKRHERLVPIEREAVRPPCGAPICAAAIWDTATRRARHRDSPDHARITPSHPSAPNRRRHSAGKPCSAHARRPGASRPLAQFRCGAGVPQSGREQETLSSPFNLPMEAFNVTVEHAGIDAAATTPDLSTWLKATAWRN